MLRLFTIKITDTETPLQKQFYRFLCFLVILHSSLNSFAHGVSDADKHAMLDGGFIKYIFLGAKHMVTGYDHLLFIFGVLFFLTQFSDVVKFITAFTLGHCLTLIFATFMGITANAHLVDAVIALTVVYKGFDNINGFKKYLKINPPNMLVLVFIFGLIHGFGLSTRLQELPLNHDRLLADILAFNIGVEAGQIAALSLMMILLAGWRKTASFAKFSYASNIALILAGLLLFGMQLNGYSHEVRAKIHSHDHHHHDHGDHGHDH